jgi:short-subunit dehydrogenase
MDLEGRRVLLTGASRGIGIFMAEAFAGAGARLAVVARDGEALTAVASRWGGDAYVADLCDREQLRDIVARVEADGGPVDVIVNNAGIETAGSITSQSADDIEHLLRLNLLAPAELCRQALPGMVARGRGHLVLISSMAAFGTLPGLGIYGASKAGVSRLAAGMRADLHGLGVGVTDVQLGPIHGDMLARAESYPPTRRGFDRLRRLGLLRNLEPAEVAAAVVSGVLGNRPHVRLPRRGALTGAWAEAPQRLVDTLLLGGTHR